MSSEFSSLELYRNELADIFKGKKYVVFLCGPSINKLEETGAKLRAKIKKALEEEGFEVVLGEDDGLEQLQKEFGFDAQQNEMCFIRTRCNAIILIASSIGAYCELGLFSYQKANFNDQLDFVLIISKEHEGKPSYLNLGPASVVDSYGKVYYEDLESFDVSKIIKRLKTRRAVFFTDSRGRPIRGYT